MEQPQNSQIYPAPPGVHWLALFLGSILVATASEMLLPAELKDDASFLIFSIWSFYLCVWIRKLNPRSISLPISVIVMGTAILADILSLPKETSPAMRYAAEGAGLVSLALAIALIFVVRAELLKHYNEREPIGLALGPVMTFIFSYLYFQYHLYQIAQFKDRQSRGDVSNPGRTLLS